VNRSAMHDEDDDADEQRCDLTAGAVLDKGGNPAGTPGFRNLTLKDGGQIRMKALVLFCTQIE
jgi:hypothetical protein